MASPELSKAGTRAVWVAHGAVWFLAAIAARLSRTGSMLELHATGRNGAELAPAHVRQILTAPTTEFKALSLTGVVVALAFAIALRAHGPRWLGWLTLLFSAVCAMVYLAGYGVR